MKYINYTGSYIAIVLLFFLLTITKSYAQNTDNGVVHGNFQTDCQYYVQDSLIGAPNVPEKFLMNGFANINYINGKFSAGFRYESYLNALQGFDPRYKGSGIPYRYVSFNDNDMKITAGNFYEQFGNGLIFRSYEERSLGYDNSIDGFRIILKPYKGITLKGLVGKQRFFFDTGPGIIRGADGEFYLNDIFKGLSDKKTQIILGASAVSKFQEDIDPIYILPKNVASFATRMNIIRGRINFMTEYAYKINDPSSVNKFIYKPGQALLVNASYSKRGLGISLGTKYIDNMDFRSDRTATGNTLNINFIPPLNKQHSYTLAAMYPYSVQPNGEIGFQGELVYNIKKKSKIGGKYGTNIVINYSLNNSIKKTELPDSTYMGYESEFFSIGDEKYFQDFNIELNRKFSKKLKVIFTYVNLIYNKNVIQGLAGYKTIYANIGILDLTYKIKPMHALQFQFQHLSTKQDNGNWAMGLIQYTMAPHWFFAVLDQYNYGNTDSEKQIHYYNMSFGYSKNTTRIALGYGKQRKGIVCVGGICRNVPASNGITFSLSSSF
ncbi:MAG: hypothetical protein IMY72_01505 [Bacteroidetes bacterium]|nr:hypothetical protein [Bacteroidota bacterium]